MIVAPAVMITACAILLGGLLGHYAAVNERLRSMARERLDLLRDGRIRSGHFEHERMAEIDAQLPMLLGRHKLIHDSILTVYCAILVLIISMLVIALAAATAIAWLATAALIVFLVGTILLMLGVGLTALEIRSSHRTVAYEVQRIAGLVPDALLEERL